MPPGGGFFSEWILLYVHVITGAPPPPPPLLRPPGSAGAPPPPPPPAPGSPSVTEAASTWGEKRSKPMNTLNWDKMVAARAQKTLWAAGGASASLSALLGKGAALQLDVRELEERFAKPPEKKRNASITGADGGAVPKLKVVTLLEQKRSQQVGMLQQRVRKDMEGKDLREAIMEVDENALTPDILRMVLEIVPTADEGKKLLGYVGERKDLDKPEQLLLSIADIPHLEARIRCMMFKVSAQFLRGAQFGFTPRNSCSHRAILSTIHR